ncbi:MAG: hypothetical protein PHW49_08650, partial [Acinetobacter harbinensis]|nr:hypothetical protein [Acinetobacter harbinensis]
FLQKRVCCCISSFVSTKRCLLLHFQFGYYTLLDPVSERFFEFVLFSVQILPSSHKKNQVLFNQNKIINGVN